MLCIRTVLPSGLFGQPLAGLGLLTVGAGCAAVISYNLSRTGWGDKAPSAK